MFEEFALQRPMKFRACRNYEATRTVKVENTWRTQRQGKLFSSHSTNHSCGVMVLVRSDLDFNLKSVEGDLISEDNKLVTNKLRELNVSPLDAFRLTCVIEALPIEWPIFLKTCNYSVSEPFNLQNQVQLNLNGQNRDL